MAWLFVGCLFVQIFLAGLGTFAGGSNFIVHRDFGHLFGLLTIVLIVLGSIGAVNGFLILLVAVWLALQARRFVAPPLGTGQQSG